VIYINVDYEYNIAKPSYNHLALKIPILCGVNVLLLLDFSVYCEIMALSSYRIMFKVRDRQFTAVRI